MADDMTREHWLAFEIELAEEFIRRNADRPDPIYQSQVAGRRRELERHRAELESIAAGPALEFHLAGKGIEGHNAPLDVVRSVVQRYGEIADEFGADVLVAPAAPGSHTIRIVAPRQQRLGEFDTFADAALAMIDLSPDAVDRDETLEQHTLDRAADFTSRTLKSIASLLKVLATNGIDVELDLTSTERSAHVRIGRDHANTLVRILEDVDQQVRDVAVDGTLSGFTLHSGRFEIDTATRSYHGTVPKARRAAAQGIAFGSQVHAVLEEITAQLSSGELRVRYRLKQIERAASDGED